MRNYFESITTAQAAEARKSTEARAAHYRRAAATARKLAELLGGKYITKRVQPDIEKAFPGCRVYIASREYSSTVYVNIAHPEDQRYSDHDEIDLVAKPAEDRHCDAAKLLESAARNDKRAAEIEQGLADFDAALGIYGALVRQYAAIYPTLCNVMGHGEVVSPDYSTTNAIKRAVTPEQFAEAAGV